MFKINWCKIFRHKTYSTERLKPFIYDTYKNADKDRKALIDAIRFSESKVN